MSLYYRINTLLNTHESKDELSLRGSVRLHLRSITRTDLETRLTAYVPCQCVSRINLRLREYLNDNHLKSFRIDFRGRIYRFMFWKGVIIPATIWGANDALVVACVCRIFNFLLPLICLLMISLPVKFNHKLLASDESVIVEIRNFWLIKYYTTWFYQMLQKSFYDSYWNFVRHHA